MNNRLMISILASLPILMGALAQAGEFTLGAGVYSSKPAYTDFKDTYGPLPIINYQGEGWSVGALGASIDLLSNENSPLALSVVLASNGDGFDDGDSKVFSGMKERDNSVDLGLAIDYKLKMGSIGVSLMGDVSSTHKGYVFDINYSNDIALLGGFFEPSVGIEMQSSNYTDYYYGVRNSEVTAIRKAYIVDYAKNPYIEYSYIYPINENFKLLHGANITKLDRVIKNSSIVNRSNAWSTFIGISYTY
jgi:outer membrane protein